MSHFSTAVKSHLVGKSFIKITNLLKPNVNLKKYLQDENILSDQLKFKNWDKNLDFPEAQFINFNIN